MGEIKNVLGCADKGGKFPRNSEQSFSYNYRVKTSHPRKTHFHVKATTDIASSFRLS